MMIVHVLDVGDAANYVCKKIYEKHSNINCLVIKIPYKSCSSKQEMVSNILKFRSYENLISACVTCISVIQDYTIPNSVYPVCNILKPYSKVVILSTSLTAKIRLHEHILQRRIRYITMDDLLDCIEKKKSLQKSFERLEKFENVLQDANCIVLGCSYFCMFQNVFQEKFVKCKFKGVVINSVDEFVNNLSPDIFK